MEEVVRTVISQYDQSSVSRTLVDGINDSIDPRASLETFYNNCWNILTAVGDGLDVWGRIVDVSRILTVPSGTYFGFAETLDASAVGFGQAPFYDGENSTSNYALTDAVYRLLILAKAAYNITDGSIRAVNAILMNLFPNRGNAWVTDGRNVVRVPAFGFAEAQDGTVPYFDVAPFGDYATTVPANMTLVYNFSFQLQPFEIAIITQSGALPKPVGVSASAIYPPPF